MSYFRKIYKYVLLEIHKKLHLVFRFLLQLFYLWIKKMYIYFIYILKKKKKKKKKNKFIY